MYIHINSYRVVAQLINSSSYDDLFTSISGGILHLLCQALLPAKLCDIGSELAGWPGGKVILDHDNKEYFVSLDCLTDADLAGEPQVYLLPLLTGKGVAEVSDRQGADFERMETSLEVEGLVLRSVCAEQNEFERVGSFNFSSLVSIYDEWNRSSESYHSFMSALQSTRSSDWHELPRLDAGMGQMIKLN